MGTRILTVEDDERIRTAVKMALEDEGWTVEETASGEEAIDAFGREQADVVLIDIMLPGMDGFELCRSLRRGSDVPIVMVTARADTHDVVAGLEAGADDYLTKPFSSRELVARVHALLRRVERRPTARTAPLTVGSVTLEPVSRRVERDGDEVHLTPTEFDLIAFLTERPARVFTREQLLSQVWGYDDGGGARTVDSHVRALRRKLGNDVIRTVHGVGYAAGDGAS